ncbi:MAG TPA: 30S ribosomal protein S20 [Candidatus Limnocylindria bacterium]|nr:30S ribosomal protein S20 [Candidatus Limnocylindria bacterium]
MAHSQRGWTGARTPSAVKRVRQTARKRVINQPRRAAAKTLVARAVSVASEAQSGASNADLQDAVQRAVSALDLAAKSGAIHRNAANRRKSRLMNKVNAAIGGGGVSAPSRAARQTGKAAAAKEAKARIAAGRAAKAKGAQTAAGKARAALSRTTRDAAAAEKPVATAAPAKTTASAKPAAKSAAKPAAKASAKPAAKAAPKPAAKKPAAKK